MARQFRTHSLTVIGPDTYNVLIGLLTARAEATGRTDPCAS
jgi:hypothetical protein